MTAAEWGAPAFALVVIAAFGLSIRAWSDLLTPALATRVLVACSAVITVACLLVLATAAAPLLGRSDGLADGRWSEEVFTREPALALALRSAALVALVMGLVRAANQLRAQRRTVRLARSFRRSMEPTAGGVVVVPTDEPDALAVNGDFVLVTRGMLRCLSAGERRAVLAHEQAHIDNRHHRYTR
ncbi:MAG: M48 family metalloprotease, partial [Frankiaceae bacterium]|nr:M48 family metalloprotease [Frankiaceae bacterium]